MTTSESINTFEAHEAWFDDYTDQTDDDFQIDEYDLTATPNDFNVLTIFSFIESGAVKIPGFQRNYVWDITRASKLIESLILGLPVPQIFLYEQARNKFLVIDGQQRLMSIYYFIKQRFPRKEKRVELRSIFDLHGQIPDNILHDDRYFTNFNLSLPEKLPNHPNKFKGLNYATLGDYKTQFELRPIRNVIVKQNSPKDDDSSIYEIFNRLNSGGINLQPQEIRTSLYHSAFYDMLYRINMLREWRKILHMPEPDLHMKDVEILLRSFAMLVDGCNYAPSLVKFLNQFSKKCHKHTAEYNTYLKELFKSFLRACQSLPDDAFMNKGNRRFNIALFEAVFTVVCEEQFRNGKLLDGTLIADKVLELASDSKFLAASQQGTTKTANVKARLQRAREIVGAL
ncbi:DUF262 domain-containing protein [Candidatus Poribacteria bacterium]|nr:DUF262 domain-containing protein [Candidatus Poribacteria bacterium]